MRTTITLTPEAESLVRRVMRERRLSFKEVVNDAIVSGLSSSSEPYSTPTFALGRTNVDLDHAMSLAGDLEDEHLLRKRELGK